MIVGITYSTKYIDSLGGESITGSWANIRRFEYNFEDSIEQNWMHASLAPRS